MYYGPEKVRQMSRSILPSTRRKGARYDLAEIKRRNRRKTKELYRELAKYVYPDDFEGDLNYYPDEKIRQTVRERRAGDKLAHYERWAVERTRHLGSPPERLGYMKALLPAGLIGDHALSHLVQLDEFNTNPYRYRWRQPRSSTPPLSPEECERRLLLVIERGQQVVLNQAIKRVHRPAVTRGYDTSLRIMRELPGHRVAMKPSNRSFQAVERYGKSCWVFVPCECVPRTLKGIHDIKPFLADLNRRFRYVDSDRLGSQILDPHLVHREWWEAAEKFLEEIR